MTVSATSDSIVDLKSQIYGSVKHLVPMFKELAESAKKFEKPIRFYVEMCQSDMESELTTLQYLSKHGDTTLENYKAY